MIDIEAVFEKFEDEHLKFERVVSPLSPRRDISAFILLDRLLPNPGRDMVVAAEHDEIYLDADLEKLADVATEDDILALIRCGVRLDRDTDGLAMFV